MAALLVVISLALYSSTLPAGFVWDDEPLIVGKGAFFRDPGNIPSILTTSDTPLQERATPYYRPVTTLTYLADYHLWGHAPFGYHLENVLLHAAATLLLYLLLLRAFDDRLLAFFSALVFAVHPVNAEAVSFVSARNNLLCGALMLSSLLLLRGGAGWAAGALGAYFLALLSKEPAVSLPFFLCSLWLLPGETRRRRGW